MFQPDQDGIFARVHVSPVRRGFACAILYGLGALMVYVAIAQPPAALWFVFLLAFGIAVLILAERMRKATKRSLILTGETLSDDLGRVLVDVTDIKSVERGVFALKPSNGFTLVLNERAPRAWQPGLWWCAGRRLGVGGVVSSGPAKFMAERIAMMIAERDAS